MVIDSVEITSEVVDDTDSFEAGVGDRDDVTCGVVLDVDDVLVSCTSAEVPNEHSSCSLTAAINSQNTNMSKMYP